MFPGFLPKIKMRIYKSYVKVIFSMTRTSYKYLLFLFHQKDWMSLNVTKSSYETCSNSALKRIKSLVTEVMILFPPFQFRPLNDMQKPVHFCNEKSQLLRYLEYIIINKLLEFPYHYFSTNCTLSNDYW